MPNPPPQSARGPLTPVPKSTKKLSDEPLVAPSTIPPPPAPETSPEPDLTAPNPVAADLPWLGTSDVGTPPRPEADAFGLADDNDGIPVGLPDLLNLRVAYDEAPTLDEFHVDDDDEWEDDSEEEDDQDEEADAETVYAPSVPFKVTPPKGTAVAKPAQESPPVVATSGLLGGVFAAGVAIGAAIGAAVMASMMGG